MSRTARKYGANLVACTLMEGLRIRSKSYHTMPQLLWEVDKPDAQGKEGQNQVWMSVWQCHGIPMVDTGHLRRGLFSLLAARCDARARSGDCPGYSTSCALPEKMARPGSASPMQRAAAVLCATHTGCCRVGACPGNGVGFIRRFPNWVKADVAVVHQDSKAQAYARLRSLVGAGLVAFSGLALAGCELVGVLQHLSGIQPMLHGLQQDWHLGHFSLLQAGSTRPYLLLSCSVKSRPCWPSVPWLQNNNVQKVLLRLPLEVLWAERYAAARYAWREIFSRHFA